MKISNFITISCIGIVFSLLACNSKKVDPVTQTPSAISADTSAQNTASTAAQPSGNAEQHFFCPKHCEGSGGAEAGKCPVCGSDYVHNDAFHKGSPAPEPQMKIDPVTQMAVPTHTEAQNANGVYHFICPKGDPGGAGVAGNCPKCGTPLEHNQAFHTK